MAFTRFSSSDLYIFPTSNDDGDGVMECCACPLLGDSLTSGSFFASTPRAFYDHLEQHEAAGHHVEGGYRALIAAIDAEAHLWFGVGH